ncbi:MAG TPA: hypothetical protein PKD69_06970, partial [Elusimicrobiota bacterium]|nr:hypothetical protein [Elusimicrobiota bacterium]
MAIDMGAHLMDMAVMVIAHQAMKSAQKYDFLSEKKFVQTERIDDSIHNATTKKLELSKEYNDLGFQLKSAKADFAVESALEKELAVIDKWSREAKEGTTSDARPIRSDAGTSPKLVQGRHPGVLLEEAERAGEAQRRFGERHSEVERGLETRARETERGLETRARETERGLETRARETSGILESRIEFLEGRKRSVGSEIQFLDRRIEILRGAGEKAKGAAVTYSRYSVLFDVIALMAQSEETVKDRLSIGFRPGSAHAPARHGLSSVLFDEANDLAAASGGREFRGAGAAAARELGDPNTTKYEYFRSGSDKSGAFAPTSLTDPISIPKPSILRRIVDYFSIEKPAATPLSPNVNADGPPLSKPDSAHAVIDDLDNSLGYIDGKPMPTPDHLKTFNPGETLPSGDKAGKGPGAASLSEYIETTLTKSEVISQGRLGFDPAFESKGAAESGMVGLSKSGLEAFRVLREAGIRVSVGSEAAWGELNAAGSHFINEVFNSPTRT